MGAYAEYIKCGDILISPSIEFKDQYILQCIVCNEYYSELNNLLLHYVDHFSVEDPEFEKLTVPLIETELVVVKTENEIVDDNVAAVDGDNSSQSFGTYEIKIDSPNSDEMEFISDYPEADINNYESAVENEQEINLQTVEMQEMTADFLDEDYEEEDTLIVCSGSDEELEKPEDTNTTRFVKNFMTIEKNITTIIAAYKNCNFLWNINLPLKERIKQRPKCLQQIAVELNKILNINITSCQVSAVIRRIRFEYIEQLKRLSSNAADAKTSAKNCWFSEQLSFLKPLQKNNSLAFFVRDSAQPDLVQDQIIDILKIYEKFPVLWNTNLAENFCNDKRLESLEQMRKTIELEMALKITQKDLESYLRRIHSTFSKQKLGNRTDLYEYMIFLQDHVGRFSCSYCNASFMHPIKYKVHLSKHDGSIPLKCSLCNKEYTSLDAYVGHCRRHMNSLKYKCKDCGKEFAKSAPLRIHQRTHTGITPYCCDICGATFRYSYAFNAHKNRHANKHSHKCSYCPKGFYSSGQLLSHIVTHTNTRNYECKICGKAFKRSSNLRSHKYVHEEGLNYPCTVCDKMFKNRLGVYHHMKTHRKNEVESCV